MKKQQNFCPDGKKNHALLFAEDPFPGPSQQCLRDGHDAIESGSGVRSRLFR